MGAETRRPLKIAIIGAGASGIMAVIKLREAGFDDVTVFEKAADLGGTWRDNRYPGLTCDVESMAYRYSFAPNPNWSKVCSPGPEILAYFRDVATRFDVVPHIRFNSEITAARFDEGQWALTSVQGNEGTFDAVIVAVGILHHPAIPAFEGQDSFAGPVFHSSQWPDDLDLAGKRVGVVGTGSTATQIVGAITGTVAHLSLFQRSAQWIMPLDNPEFTPDQIERFGADPDFVEAEYQRINDEQCNKFAAAVVGANPRVYERIDAMCRAHLAESVADPALRAKLTPDHKVGCKRLIMSHNFYDAIQQPHAALVTDAIARIEPGGVRTADGRLHELDALVLATGFNTHQFMRPMQVEGRDGLTLDQAWAERNAAYMSLTVPGFPNWMMIGGPNSPIGNFSWLRTAECQVGYAIGLIELLARAGVRRIEPTPQALEAYNAALTDQMPQTIWASGCNSWYIDAAGRVASYPWTYAKFQADMAAPVLEDFVVSGE